MSWWEIKEKEPFGVCFRVEENAQDTARAYLNGKEFGFDELTQKQRDDLLFGAVWDSSGAYQLAGMTYRLVHQRSRWRWVVTGLLALNSVLLVLIWLR